MYEEIVDKIALKGWNLYDAGRSLEQNLFLLVPRGNVSSLEKGINYLLLPQISNPQDIGQMQSAIVTMAMKKQPPLVRYGSATITVAAFVINERGVLVHAQRPVLFPYTSFVQVLDTLTDRLEN